MRSKFLLSAVMSAVVLLSVFSPAIAAEPFSQTSPPADTEEIVVLTTSLGTIKIRLFPDLAPQSVANFKKLASEGFYDNLLFHRVIPGFVIQTGDPLSRDDDPSNDGTGGPGYTIPDEITDQLRHLRGAVGMANAGPNTNGSQFFINLRDNKNLDGIYTVFGQVYDGLSAVDAIASVPTELDRPLTPVTLQSITVASAQTAPSIQPATSRPGRSIIGTVFWVLLWAVIVLGLVLLGAYVYLKRSMPSPRPYNPESTHRKKQPKTYGINK